MMTERYADRESTDPIGTDAPTTRLFIDERDAGTLEPRTSLGTLSDADVLLVRRDEASIGAFGRFPSSIAESVVESIGRSVRHM